MRIISGWYDGKQSKDPITHFKLQLHRDNEWYDIDRMRITRRRQVELLATFPEIHSDCIRLVVTGTPGNISRIWEIEFYHSS